MYGLPQPSCLGWKVDENHNRESTHVLFNNSRGRLSKKRYPGFAGIRPRERDFEPLAHTYEVRIIPAKVVAPFRQGHKTDSNDALAVAEAARRPNIKEAPIKTTEQQGLHSRVSVPSVRCCGTPRWVLARPSPRAVSSPPILA